MVIAVQEMSVSNKNVRIIIARFLIETNMYCVFYRSNLLFMPVDVLIQALIRTQPQKLFTDFVVLMQHLHLHGPLLQHTRSPMRHLERFLLFHVKKLPSRSLKAENCYLMVRIEVSFYMP
jgi:hypothetical protein